MYSQEEFHASHILFYICEIILLMFYIFLSDFSQDQDLLSFNLVFKMLLEKTSNLMTVNLQRFFRFI